MQLSTGDSDKIESGCHVHGQASLKITFEARLKPSRNIEAFGGLTLMEAAVQGGIEEIEAQCGGGCACGTCHVYIPEAWRTKAGPASGIELDLLDSLDNRRPNSRLSCQINLSPDMDGMVVELPG